MILENSKPTSIKLGNKEYQLPNTPLSLNTLCGIEKNMGMGGRKLAQALDEKPNSTIRLALYALLKEKNDLTIEQVGDLITTENIGEISKVISDMLLQIMGAK
jgi:hypothetical protein